MAFLFNGGDCSQSFNVQEVDGKFTCQDSGAGVPTQSGEKSYIVVTDLDGNTVFHDDWVDVGSLFTLFDGGNEFPSDQLVTIYSSNETGNSDNILQRMQYHSSCSQNLFLKDRFGAIQLVVWKNEDQGTVSCFSNRTFLLDITVPIDIEGGTATLESLTVGSNVDPFFFNLTDKVAGIEADGGDIIQVEISIPVDLTERRTYNLLITLNAVTPQGRDCSVTELTSFSAGNPLPPIFPTVSPTQAPSGTNPPTPDPEASACSLDADIDCQTSSGRSCRSLRAPASLVCTSQGGLTSIDFLFTGKNCGATPNCQDTDESQAITDSQVFIFAEGEGGVIAFQEVVEAGQFFRISSGLDDRLAITISTVNDGVPELPLQVLERVNLGCEGTSGQDLTLLQDYGALQLTGFSNPDQGINSVLEDVTMTYTVRNDGIMSATALTANRTSAFEPGSFDLLEGSPVVLAPDESRSFSEVSILNLQDGSGNEYVFDFQVSGEGTQSGIICGDSRTYLFRVES